jgi:ribose transport system ATP-binding protein
MTQTAATAASTATATATSTRKSLPRNALPLVLLSIFVFSIGAYTQGRNGAFLSELSLNGLFIAAIPLSLAAIAQTNALMVRALDVSLGFLITFGVVIASFTIPVDASAGRIVLGALGVVGACLGVGLFNIFLTKVLGIASIIATLSTLSILTGVCLLLRPTSAGSISGDFGDFLLTKVHFMPIAFVLVVIGAIAGDIWLYRSGGGLRTRAVGLDEVSAERLGARAGRVFVRAFIISSVAGALAAFFLAAQVLIGDPNIGANFTLNSLAAAVLGGASLTGGRGSYVGAIIGALLLTEFTIVVPFIGLHTSWSQMIVGGLTLLALLSYQGPDLLRARGRQAPRPARATTEAAAPEPGESAAPETSIAEDVPA